ncbi:MAG: O-antigen ligase family protein [Desulfuromonas sp.]|nr:O-antigen ligase family protein [Desulfuromonas sp.]
MADSELVVGGRYRDILLLMVFIFLSQLLNLPFFLDASLLPKFIFSSASCFLFIVFYPPKKIAVYRFDVLLVVFFSTLFCSSWLSSHPSSSFVAYLSLLAMIFGRLSLDHVFRDNIRQSVYFLRCYSIFSLIAAILGLFEYFSFSFLGKSTVPLIPYLLPPNLGSRVVGTYGQPNLFALLLLSGLLVYVYLYLHDDEFCCCRLKWLCYLPFLTVAVSFFMTGSRAGQLALALTFLPLSWLVVRQRYLAADVLRHRRFFKLAATIVLAYLLVYGLNEFFSLKCVRELGDTGASIETRFLLWMAAILIFLDYPLLGVGLDNYKFYLPEYANKAHDVLGFVQYEAMGYTGWAHNEVLQLLCEGGVVVGLVLLLALSGLFGQLLVFAVRRQQWSPLKLYSHLFLFPFVIHSMFSWPFRHPALLVLFFTFLLLLLSQGSYRAVCVSAVWQGALRFVAGCCLVVLVLATVQEVRMGGLAQKMIQRGAQVSFGEFEQLVKQPYNEYPLLLKLTSRYVYVAVKEKDALFARQIQPYVQKLVDLQGTYWQWYNLSLVYLLLDQKDDAMLAVSRAIDLRPTEETYWALQHHLSMLKAAGDTGQPLETFLPIPPGGDFEKIKEIYFSDDRFQIGM